MLDITNMLPSTHPFHLPFWLWAAATVGHRPHASIYELFPPSILTRSICYCWNVPTCFNLRILPAFHSDYELLLLWDSAHMLQSSHPSHLSFWLETAATVGQHPYASIYTSYPPSILTRSSCYCWMVPTYVNYTSLTVLLYSVFVSILNHSHYIMLNQLKLM
jgi:hypothetical protein